MENLLKAVLEKIVNGIMILIFTGSIVGWTIDMQIKAAKQKKMGLISLQKINQKLFK